MSDQMDTGTAGNEGTENPSNNFPDVPTPPPAYEGNPAFKELYDVLPESLYPVVRPVVDKWDTNQQRAIQERSEQLKAYEPYKTFAENQVDPQNIEQALMIAQLIDQNPQEFYEQLGAFLNVNNPPDGSSNNTPSPVGNQNNGQPPQAQQEDTFGEVPFNIEETPGWQQLKQQQDIIAAHLANQVRMEEQAAADKQLQDDLTALKTKHGDYDEEYVIALAANGMDLEKAVERYQNMYNGIRNRPSASSNLPDILSPTGNVPSEKTDVTEWTPEQTRKYVMNVLAQAHNNQG